MTKTNQTGSAGRPTKSVLLKAGHFAAALLLALPVAQLAFGQDVPPPPPVQLPPPTPAPPPVMVPVPQVLSGHVPPQVGALSLTPIGPLAATQRLDLAIGLPLRNQEALTDLLQQLSDPGSPNFRRYLSAEDFARRFGPTEQDYQEVTAFAEAQGLAVTATHPNRTLLDVSGSVADIEQAFHVRLLQYQHPYEARQFRAPDVEPSVDLPVPLLHIGGLNDYTRPLPGSGTGSGTNGSFMGKDFRAAYVPGATGLTGTGQTIAIVSFESDYHTNDITAYETAAGLSNVLLYKVQLSGYNGSTQYDNLEISLDIEMAISMAPGVNSLTVYEGTFDKPEDMFNRIATDNSARQIASSWFSYGNAFLDQIFQQFAAQGQTFFNCSGDGNAYNYFYAHHTPYTIFDPMPDSWLTDVGGTDLTTTGPGGSYSAETVWNQGDYGSGGGFGYNTNGIPSAFPWWQAGVVNQANQASTNYRNFPDVAMVASGAFCIHDNGQIESNIDGTSVATPLWAGFTALVNQQAAANRYPSVGFLNPALYEIGLGPNYTLCFHDITNGNNFNQWSTNQFRAVQGYDLCTGWGTPTGTNLINELIKASDSAVSCGQLNDSDFSFNIGFGAAVPAQSAYIYETANVATNPAGWSQVLTFQPTNGYRSFTDTTVGTNVTQRYYRVECGTNCWRPTGFAMVQVAGQSIQLLANQFDAPVNTLDGLFNPMPTETNQYLPNGAKIYIQNTTGSWTFNPYVWNRGGSSNYWTMAGTNVAGSVTLSPGEGFWLSNSSPSKLWVTFAGLVRQGTLNNPVPTTNAWAYSSMLPQAGGLQTSLGYSPALGDEVYIWDVTNYYPAYSYCTNRGGGNPAWTPSEPSIQVGQAFLLLPAATNLWTRTFTTCQ